MPNTTTAATVTAQLARLGLSDLSELHAIAQGTLDGRDLVEEHKFDARAAVTARYLADVCYAALVRVDGAEKQAAIALGQLRDYTAEQIDGTAPRTAQWVQQQADFYAERLAVIAEHLHQFETCALALASLLGRRLTA